jgi:hypothetical protein
MNAFAAQLEQVAAAAVVDSPGTFSWFGERSQPLPRALRSRLSRDAERGYLHATLAARLYEDCYVTGRARPSGAPAASGASVGAFAERLRASNTGAGPWQDGWQVDATTNGTATVSRRGLTVVAPSSVCRAGAGKAFRPGARVELRLPSSLDSIAPGYYSVLGDLELDDGAEPLVRLYWNLTPAAAAPFVRGATEALNGAGLAFRLKVVDDPTAFRRADSAVVYLRRADYSSAIAVLAPVHARLARTLAAAAPMLTKPIARGLAVAEDPGFGQSFGMHRCGLVAEGLIDAHERGGRRVDARVRHVRERLEAVGIDPRRPYLSPGSDDVYDAIATEPGPRARRRRAPGASGEKLLDAAARIGASIIAGAVWHRGSCNWVGARPLPHVHGGALAAPTHAALGPDLYGGTAGVGIFLAELHVATGEAAPRRAALGSIAAALRAVRSSPGMDAGLYTGSAGVAYAAARIGALLGAGELRRHAEEAIGIALRRARDTSALDLLSGRAGIAIALLSLGRQLDDERLVERAVRVADGTLDGPDAESSPARTPGLAHGAAGIALAFAEVHAATGEERHRAAAEAALRAEDRWFSARAGNWSDPRFGGRGRRRASTSSYSAYWCHGAPGIGLARARVGELLDGTPREEVRVALATTRAAIRAMLAAPDADFSLCHGASGLAEIATRLEEALGEPSSGLATEVAEAGTARYLERGTVPPLGTGHGTTPSLLLGLAGIGMSYLRLRDPRVAPVLWLDTREQGGA